jgi:hypothetical protein
MSDLLIIFVAIVAVRLLPYDGICWGGKNSPHPGLWLTKTVTVRVRKVGKRSPSDEA